VFLAFSNTFDCVRRLLSGFGFGLSGGTHSEGAPRGHQPQAIGLFARLQTPCQERLRVHVMLEKSLGQRHTCTHTQNDRNGDLDEKKRKKEKERHIPAISQISALQFTRSCASAVFHACTCGI
jgi:hypothetical protein